MTTFAELDKLTSKELHDKAVERAKKHMDVRFFWDLLKDIPAAEAMSGDVAEADVDITHVSRLVADATEGGTGKLAEMLRPIYIDYLMKHGDEE